MVRLTVAAVAVVTESMRRALLQNLTELEQLAIDAAFNLTDGHPRQTLTTSQATIVQRLPVLFAEAAVRPLADLEYECKESFFSLLGQHSAPIADGRVFSVYSSSVATMAVAAAFAESGSRVGLLHPTFDNLHDLMNRVLPVVPIEEGLRPTERVRAAVEGGASVLFLTTPNNPTGQVVNEHELREYVTLCLEYDLTLCLDTSFRGFDPRAQFDHYSLLESSGVRYIIVEDSGKLWPVLEMKLGFVAVSRHWREQVEHALSDILLSVSPLVLALVRELSRDAMAGGMQKMQQLISRNRRIVSDAVRSLSDVRVLDEEARVSVLRLEFESSDLATEVREELHLTGMHVLPCDQFHWSDPSQGRRTLRIALSRDESVIQRLVTTLIDVMSSRKLESVA